MQVKRRALAVIFILAIAIVIVGFVIELGAKPTETPSNPSQKPTPTPTPTLKIGNVTVSGLIIVHGLTIPPTEVAFINGETQEVYKAPINQANLSYTISLPINQTYGIEGDWNGRTFNATGLPMSSISMRLDNGGWILNLHDSPYSIKQNLQVGMTPP